MSREVVGLLPKLMGGDGRDERVGVDLSVRVAERDAHATSPAQASCA